ncbi:hypothetical protein IFVP177_C2170009 [Vibrio parahaemolyticus]
MSVPVLAPEFGAGQYDAFLNAHAQSSRLQFSLLGVRDL